MLKSGVTKAGIVALAVLAVLVLGIVTLKVVQSRTHAPSLALPLSERFESDTKLIVARYPSDFHARSVSGGIVLGRTFPDGSDEALSLIAIRNPIARDVKKFSQVVLDASTSKLHEYRALTLADATCNGQPGVEATGTWINAEDGSQFFRRACAFVRRGHGYCFSWSVQQRYKEEHRALLQSIVDATEFSD